MASSATLTVLLLGVLYGQRFASGTGNTNQGARICKPQPNGDTLGQRSTCPYVVIEDNDFRRVPAIIYHFSCNCPESRCSDQGDYRCVQVRKMLPVAFQRFNAGKTTFQKKVVNVNASCVCATPKAQALVTKDRILDETGKHKEPDGVEGVIRIHDNDPVDEHD
uniref:Putative conserved secreted protein midgut overexpressed n=2 Tax=Rhipicephalus microplus TaxID=6941 RepID=A0A6M2CGN3_RHIMP